MWITEFPQLWPKYCWSGIIWYLFHIHLASMWWMGIRYGDLGGNVIILLPENQVPKYK